MSISRHGETSQRTERKLAARPRNVLFVLLAAMFIAAIFVFLFVGDWLVAEDPLQKADAIAVLSGGLPLRAEEAAKLYRAGYAPKVWLTHSTEPGATLAAMSIVYNGEDAYNRQILSYEGVPPASIEVLNPPIRNTADEITAIFSSLNAAHAHTIIIVTSKVHTRRTRILAHRLARGNFHVIVRGVSNDPFQPSRWWSTTGDALDVVREVLGILNAWAGLPLHPSQ